MFAYADQRVYLALQGYVAACGRGRGRDRHERPYHVATTGSITPYVVAALFYLVITLPLARLVSGLEARLLGTAETKKKRPAKSAGQVVATPADHIAGL